MAMARMRTTKIVLVKKSFERSYSLWLRWSAAWARDGRKLAKKLATVAGGACLQADNQNRSLQSLVWEASRTLDKKEHCSYCCLVNYLDEEPRRGDRKLAG